MDNIEFALSLGKDKNLASGKGERVLKEDTDGAVLAGESVY